MMRGEGKKEEARERVKRDGGRSKYRRWRMPGEKDTKGRLEK